MDQQLAPAELLRFLQAEAETLQQIQVKISNELHHLQVEEQIFVRTVERLNENYAGRNRSTTTKGATAAGMELVQALHQELASGAVPLPVSISPAPDSVHLISSLPPGLSMPTAITETKNVKELKVEPQSAAPSGVGLDDDAYEYELLDRLESDDE